jgi:hypothetical protein
MAKNEAVSREGNEEIEEAQQLDPPGRRSQIACECALKTCGRLVTITVDEYRQVRSNFVSELNSSAPHPAHRYTPGSFVEAYAPVNGRSVPCCGARRTARASGAEATHLPSTVSSYGHASGSPISCLVVTFASRRRRRPLRMRSQSCPGSSDRICDEGSLGRGLEDDLVRPHGR